jgi:hypothetical protein
MGTVRFSTPEVGPFSGILIGPQRRDTETLARLSVLIRQQTITFRFARHSGRKDWPQGFDWQGPKEIDGGNEGGVGFTVQKYQRMLQTHYIEVSFAQFTAEDPAERWRS